MTSTDQKSTGAPLYENLRKLITVIDELRDVGLQQYIKLPRIAVVGTQSAGKSSLLESIVGLDFLPRGDGVVTRRPLELRLVHVPPDDSGFKPYAVFPNKSDEKIYDFQKVHDQIVKQTEEVCGSDKGIVDDPIIMKCYSQTCPDLTLIDLPGITRIPQKGQAKDIERITTEMCRRYAKDPRTIILCVVPANQDMSTSDAIKLAHEEDPDGVRTFGVITKIDIMDKGTNARKMLLGQEIQMKLGYVGVKGRSQLDIQNKVTVKEALKLEKDFFASHPIYSTLPPGHTGTEALTQRLTKVLFGHIRNTLPEISKEIQQKIKECEERLKDLGQPLPSNQKDKMQLIWNMITDFVENFKNNIKGKYDPKRNARVSNDISGGAKIKMFFGDLYSEFNDTQPTEHYSDEQINRAIVLHQGDSIPGFPSVDSFLYLIAPLLKRLRDPAHELLNTVHGYLENIAQQLIDKVFARFPSIIPDITDIVGRVFKEERDIAKDLIENVIESERSFIFTNDLEYMSQRTSFIPDTEEKSDDPKKANKKLDPQEAFVKEMRARIDSYFIIALRNIKDTVPKIVGHFLVKAVQDKLQYTLYNEINKNDGIVKSVGEPPHITAERGTLQTVLTVLQKAKRVLTKDPDLAPQFNTHSTGSTSHHSHSHNHHSYSSSPQRSGRQEESKQQEVPSSYKAQPTQSTPKQQTTTNNTSGTKDIFGSSLNRPKQGGGGGGSTGLFG